MAVNSFGNIDYTIPGSGMTLISTTAASGASVTLSSIPQTYNYLYLLIYGITNATSNGRLEIRPNNAASICRASFVVAGVAGQAITNIQPGGNGSTSRTDANNCFSVNIFNYSSTTNYKNYNFSSVYTEATPSAYQSSGGGGIISNTAISSLVINNTGGDFSTGTILLYGVK
jgi:hypothetical protein